MLNYNRSAVEVQSACDIHRNIKEFFSEGRLSVRKDAKWIYNEGGHEIQSSPSCYDSRCLDLCSNVFFCKSPNTLI